MKKKTLGFWWLFELGIVKYLRVMVIGWKSASISSQNRFVTTAPDSQRLKVLLWLNRNYFTMRIVEGIEKQRKLVIFAAMEVQLVILEVALDFRRPRLQFWNGTSLLFLLGFGEGFRFQIPVLNLRFGYYWNPRRTGREVISGIFNDIIFITYVISFNLVCKVGKDRDLDSGWRKVFVLILQPPVLQPAEKKGDSEPGLEQEPDVAPADRK